jgi:hypothetical protein
MHFLASLFSGIFTLVGLVVTVGAMGFAFMAARGYVRNRLRFVDAVRNPVAPWLAGIVATLILIPVVGILSVFHLVAGGTALLVGASTGFGTASGVKALKRGE